jgi:hypothetical protein
MRTKMPIANKEIASVIPKGIAKKINAINIK